MDCQLLYGFFGTIIGVIIGASLAYFFGIKLQREQERRRAGAEFISAFVEEVKDLESIRIEAEPFHIFRSGISKHKQAAVYFSYFLGKSKRRRFNKDWDTYYSQADSYRCNSEKRKEYTELLLKRIKKLLEYADQG